MRFMLQSRKTYAVALLVGLLSASTAWAQNTGSITGVARDTSGAVLPGVTVEAASSALIEKVRVVVTDGTGRFNVTNLPPGTYSVAFTLPGFSTFRREGVELSAGVAATANAEMAVGSLEETVTVTGATPVVDIQNVRTQESMDLSVMEALPSGSRDSTALVALTLGATNSTQGRNDVGGAMTGSNTSLSIHGSRGDDAKMNYAGGNMNSLHGNGGGQMRLWQFNTISVQETTIDVSGSGSKTETGGANVNMIPREGGNQFSLHSVLAYTHGNLASGAVPQTLLDRGSADDQKSLKQVWDYGVGFGGAIVQDRIWYYGSVRLWGGQAFGSNTFVNNSPDFWRPQNSTERSYTDGWYRDGGGRFTVQLNDRMKLNAGVQLQLACNCNLGTGLGQPDYTESVTDYAYTGAGGEGTPMIMVQGDWSFTPTNSLLIQANMSMLRQAVTFGGIEEQRVSIRDAAIGRRWGALPGGHDDDFARSTNNSGESVTVAYVTGSHKFEAGFDLQQGNFIEQGGTRRSFLNGTRMPQWDAVNYNFLRGVPISIVQFASPLQGQAILRKEAIFAQDQWTIDRWTLNLGIRYDHFNGKAAALSLPAGPFIGARSFEDVENIPNYRDISPRLGLAYDVFGDGRTAVKFSWGSYVQGQGGLRTSQLSPSLALINSTSRGWNDANGNYAPDCDLTNFGANGECAAISDPLFGTPTQLQSWDKSARDGWGIREANYQTSLVLQHELLDGVGLEVGYHRTWWRNKQALIDQSRTAADYTSGCITAPSDSELGDVSGQQVCGIYDVNFDALLRPQDIHQVLVSDINKSGIDPKDIFNGLDIGINARFSNGALVMGGLTFGRQDFDFCWANGMPQANSFGFNSAPGGLPRTDEYCNITGTLWDGTGSQAKIQFVYPLPYDFTVSGSYKHLPGLPLDANYVALNFEIRNSLGRDLSQCTLRGTPGAGCTANTSVSLDPTVFNTSKLHDERVNQVDLKLAKAVTVGGLRLNAGVELYNVLDNRVLQGTSGTYGAAGNRSSFWKFPFSMLGGRLLKFTGSIDF